MSGWKTVLKNKSITTITVALAAAMVTTAAGALSVTTGLWPLDRTWIWICFAWGVAGNLCCRCMSAEGSARILQIAVRFVLVAAFVWLLGYFVAEKGSGFPVHWARYIASFLIGSAAALLFSRRGPQRKRRKTAAYRPQKRSTVMKT